MSKFNHWMYFIATLLLCACTFGKPEPPELAIDRTACSKCKMLISDQRFAAAYQADESMPFDDIGCMLSQVTTLSKQPEYIWVRDYAGNRWLDARSAVYIKTSKAGTPMNYGFIALADSSQAQKTAQQLDGQSIYNWDALISMFKERK